MPPQIAKFAPTAIVAVLAAWCCWPYLGGAEPAGGTSQPSRLTTINSSLLAPSIAGVCGRDPFQPPSPEKPAPAERKQPEQTAEKATFRGASPPKEDGADRPANLVLDGTCIRGDRPLALINGQLYAPGEALVAARPAAAPYVVRKIYPQKVLLEHRGEMLELTYRNPPQKTDRTEIDT